MTGTGDDQRVVDTAALRYAVMRHGVGGGKDYIEAAFVYAMAADAYMNLRYPVGGASVEQISTGARVKGVTNHGVAILDIFNEQEAQHG